MRPSIYGDADVSPLVIQLLRQAGFDAVSCHEIGAGHASDEWQLTHATGEGRVVLTYNVKDFRRLAIDWANMDKPHAGVLASHRQYSTDQVGVLLGALLAFLRNRTADDMANTMLILPRPQSY